MIEEDGWILSRIKSSHHHFHHPQKSGIVTIVHPKKVEKPGTASSILRQAGLKLRKE
ncbi:MAG: type II toxin-antitoxin system HicA family toxin [Treponema sp.]|nr:type II toxin-antitoxin system HicA family toxin [Treponema sp.]